MIKFILKGLLRDRQRSLFPLIIVATGVMLTVLANSWITGILGDMTEFNARFVTGHVKIVTRSYAKNLDQMPVDLAMDNSEEILARVKKQFPGMEWVQRIRFGGLVDVPDKNGETRSQGAATGLAVDLFSAGSGELQRLKIKSSLTAGSLPKKPGEILLSAEFAKNLNVRPGDEVTLIGSTMYGAMSMYNFKVSGLVEFGIRAMDRGSFIMDITDAQQFLDMSHGASEILGYFPDGIYDQERAEQLSRTFNAEYAAEKGRFVPEMMTLARQGNMADYLAYVKSLSSMFIFVFVAIMAVVLWNAGLIGGLRRYGEIGLRLAIGEAKGELYRSMLYESVLIGLIGSLIGTLIGLGFSYILQTKGIDIGNALENSKMMIPTTFRAQITPQAYYIGFLPGLISTVLGTALSGIGIYRRKTAQLFKELES